MKASAFSKEFEEAKEELGYMEEDLVVELAVEEVVQEVELQEVVEEEDKNALSLELLALQFVFSQARKAKVIYMCDKIRKITSRARLDCKRFWWKVETCVETCKNNKTV